MVINPIVGVYIPIIRIPIKGGMTIPNIATFDHGTCVNKNVFFPTLRCIYFSQNWVRLGWIFNLPDTNSKEMPLKMNGWKMKFPFGDSFLTAMLVLGVSIYLLFKENLPFWCRVDTLSGPGLAGWCRWSWALPIATRFYCCNAVVERVEFTHLYGRMTQNVS